MSEEDKENNYIARTPLNRRLISSQKPSSSKRFTPYKTPNSQRFARILANPLIDDRNKYFENPGRNITNLTPPDSPERSSSFTKTTLLASTRRGRELTTINSDIRFVVEKTWRLHQCSPLYDFQISSIESYKKLLLAHLQSLSVAKGQAFQVNQDVRDTNGNFIVDLTILKDFSFYDTDETGLKVTVYQSSTGGKLSSILNIIFCNFGNSFDSVCKQDGFTCLPVCLVKGPVGLTRLVLSWFQSEFDCIITSFKMPPMELNWYSSLWAGIPSQKGPSSFELWYNVPSVVEGLKRIMLNFDSDDIKLLWDSCHSNDTNIFTGEESEVFMDSLNSYFYNHFKVSLDSLSLSRICTSVVYLSSEGQIKILQAKYVRHILQQITASALEMQQHGRL